MTGEKVQFTRRSLLISAVCGCCVPLTRSFAATSTASVGEFNSTGLPSLLELGIDPMKRIGQTVWVSQLAPGLWLHTTTAMIAGGEGVYFPANGLVLDCKDGSLLIDTGYLPEHAEELLNWSKQSLRSPVTRAVATHFHRDRTGGIPALEAAGIPTFGHPLTRELALSHGISGISVIADFVHDVSRIAGECELFFPGAGHTRDNITAWLPRHKVLFGGCFLKSTTSADLGNLAEAVVADWGPSAQRVQTKYRSRRFTIPGHGTIQGDPVAHTLTLLATRNDKAAVEPT